MRNYLPIDDDLLHQALQYIQSPDKTALVGVGLQKQFKSKRSNSPSLLCRLEKNKYRRGSPDVCS